MFTGHTVEDAIGDQSTGVVWPAVLGGDGLAVSIVYVFARVISWSRCHRVPEN